MHVLVVGGSGRVGSLVLPHLAREHRLRLFDPHPPQEDLAGVEYVPGDARNPAELDAAARGTDALLYMAMGIFDEPGKGDAWTSDEAQIDCFDVSVKGLYFALRAAHRAGVSQAVYTSSLSVYQSLTWGKSERRYYVDEDMPPDAQHIYGFTKRLGEEVCHNAAREWRMDVNVLRLCHPRADAHWLQGTKLGEPTIATAATDVANALLAALAFRGGGFQAFFISGDYEQKLMRMEKAKRLLGWEPRARPVRTEDAGSA